MVSLYEKLCFKGLFANFKWWVHGTVFKSGIRFTLSVFHSFVLCERNVHLYGVGIGPITPLLLQLDHILPIRDNEKLVLLKVNPGSLDPPPPPLKTYITPKVR